jgi:hypothetical protein
MCDNTGSRWSFGSMSLPFCLDTCYLKDCMNPAIQQVREQEKLARPYVVSILTTTLSPCLVCSRVPRIALMKLFK